MKYVAGLIPFYFTSDDITNNLRSLPPNILLLFNRYSDEMVSMAAGEVIHVTELFVTSQAPVTLGSTLEATATLCSYMPQDTV